MKTRQQRLNAMTLVATCSILLLALFADAADGDLKGAVDKVAGALATKNVEAAKKEVVALKEADLAEVMSLFKIRRPTGKGGVGIGSKPGAITPDGIEAKFIALGGKPLSAKDAGAQAEIIAEAAYRAAAIASIAHDKCPVDKKQGDKDPKKWKEWTEEMHKAAIDLAEAAKTKKPQDMKKAATKLNDSCTNCHGVFRD